MSQIPPKGSTNEHFYAAGLAFSKEGLTFRNANCEPFSLHGIFYADGAYRRTPWQAAYATSKMVYDRHTHTAGGRIRFVTDSDKVAIVVKMPCIEYRPIMSIQAVAGFDLYEDVDGREVYFDSFVPAIDAVDGYEGLVTFPDRKKRTLTLYFPLYNDVSSLEIGLRDDAALEAAPEYKLQKPLLFYGSSITQGSSVSRPGLAYPAVIARRLGADHINLGFAGSCKAEKAIVDHIATIDASVYILDYDHNSPTPDYLQKTHYDAYQSYRAAHPDTPIVLVTRPTCYPELLSNQQRRLTVMQTFTRAIQEGDRNIWFVDGCNILQGEDRFDFVVDTLHPNDLGQMRMAEVIGETIDKALRKAETAGL